MTDRLISERAVLDAIYTRIEQIGYKHDSSVLSIGQAVRDLPSAQSQFEDPDWSYDDDAAEITLVVPKDVYESAKTIFLSVGYEGELYLRGKVYFAQPQRMKGRWVEHKWAEEVAGLLISNYACSCCSSWERTNSDYCPNCGADMREVKNDN